MLLLSTNARWRCGVGGTVFNHARRITSGMDERENDGTAWRASSGSWVEGMVRLVATWTSLWSRLEFMEYL